MYSQVTVRLLLHYDSVKGCPFYCQRHTPPRCQLHPPWGNGATLQASTAYSEGASVQHTSAVCSGVQTPLARARTKGRQMRHPGCKTSGGTHYRGHTGPTVQVTTPSMKAFLQFTA